MAGATGGVARVAVAEFQNARPDLSRHHGRTPAAPNRTARPVKSANPARSVHNCPDGRPPTLTVEPATS